MQASKIEEYINIQEEISRQARKEAKKPYLILTFYMRFLNDSEVRSTQVKNLSEHYIIVIDGKKYSFSSNQRGNVVYFTQIDENITALKYSLDEFINVLNNLIVAEMEILLYEKYQMKQSV